MTGALKVGVRKGYHWEGGLSLGVGRVSLGVGGYHWGREGCH